MALISVIVPVYNVEEYLPRCVESIRNQSFADLEIILVDDGSKDGSGRICDELARQDPRIKVIHKENGGLSSARNAGIDVARGDYLAFVDSDDWLEPFTYAYMLDLLRTYDVKVCCAGRWDVDAATGEKTRGLCPKKEEKITTEELVGRIFLWDNCDSSAVDKLYHRSLFEHFRYPLGVVSEDVAVTYRILLQTEFAAMGDKPVYDYYHRKGSISKSQVSDKTFHFSRHTAEIYEYIRSHHPAILPQAEFLRVKSLSHLLLFLENKGERSWEKYPEEYAFARKELKKHLPFLLKTPWLGKQDKITDVLLILGLYRSLRKLVHRDR